MTDDHTASDALDDVIARGLAWKARAEAAEAALSRITIVREKPDSGGYKEWTVDFEGGRLTIGSGEYNPVSIDLGQLPALLADIERVRFAAEGSDNADGSERRRGSASEPEPLQHSTTHREGK